MKMPEVGILFPRSKRLPEEKVLTKWEKFAKEKGIKKHKRAGMKYDEGSKGQVARWGRKSKNNKMDVAIMEEKQFGKNPFEMEKTKKKLRVEK